ncbi:MAG: O-antigen ligase family protein [Myxococcota bacterium]|nr:O-antigen ligase family protein [Myxococcota bacterium]
MLLCGICSTLSRSGIATLGVSVSILLIGAYGKKAIIPILGLSIFAASLLLWRQLGVDKVDPYSLSRLAIWQASAEVALSNPLGVGLGGYGEAMRIHGVPLDGFIRYPKLATQAHSELFQIWTELGWLGLVALLSGVCTLGYAFKKRYSAGQAISRDLAIFSTFALPALVSTTMHAPIIPAVATIWVAGAIRSAMPLGAPTTLSTGKSRIPYAGLCCLLTLFLAIPGVLGKHYRTRALHLRSQDNIPGAIESSRLASRWAPWSVATHLLQESLHYKATNDALKSSERLVALADDFPHDPRPLQRALLLLGKISPNEVGPSRSAIKRKLLKEIINRDPINALAWRDLALIDREDQDLAAAHLSLSRSIEIEPHCASCLAIQADILKQGGNITEAFETAQRALEAHHSSPPKRNEYSTKILHLNPKMKKLVMEVTKPNP